MWVLCGQRLELFLQEHSWMMSNSVHWSSAGIRNFSDELGRCSMTLTPHLFCIWSMASELQATKLRWCICVHYSYGLYDSITLIRIALQIYVCIWMCSWFEQLNVLMLRFGTFTLKLVSELDTSVAGSSLKCERRNMSSQLVTYELQAPTNLLELQHVTGKYQ